MRDFEGNTRVSAAGSSTAQTCDVSPRSRRSSPSEPIVRTTRGGASLPRPVSIIDGSRLNEAGCENDYLRAGE